jgi:hypothetical protein
MAPRTDPPHVEGDAPRWPGYPDTPQPAAPDDGDREGVEALRGALGQRPAIRAGELPTDVFPLPPDLSTHPVDEVLADFEARGIVAELEHARETLAQVRDALGAMPGESTGDAARRVAALARATYANIERTVRAEVAEREAAGRPLHRALREDVAAREAEGRTPTTRMEVVGADLELAAATAEEQADATIRIAEERAGRKLSADELRTLAAPSARWLRALAVRITERDAEEARQRAGLGYRLEDVEVTPNGAEVRR